MIAVDTNVLVRALVDDPGNPKQVNAARIFLRKIKKVYVPQLVQAELVWVLESAYRVTRAEIAMVLEHLLNNQAYTLQNESIFSLALTAYKGGKADFADFLILAECRSVAAELFTFDRNLSRADGASLLA